MCGRVAGLSTQPSRPGVEREEGEAEGERGE
jgi:hypothetical protein